MAAVDMKNVEIQFPAVGGEVRQDLAGIAGMKDHPPGKLLREITHAIFRIFVAADVDAVVGEAVARGKTEQRAVARVDADFEQALLEANRAPEIAPRGREGLIGHTVEEIRVAVPIEDPAFDEF